MKKLLVIKDRNKTLYIKNRKVRTPCTIEVTDKEIENLRLTLKMTDVQNYSIHPLSMKEDKTIFESTDKEVVIEELESIDLDKPKSILEKLMNGEPQ